MDGTIATKFSKEKEESPYIFQTLFMIESSNPESISKRDQKKKNTSRVMEILSITTKTVMVIAFGILSG